MAMVHLTIDGVPVSVEEGTTVLKAAHAAGIKIPTLCWLKDINEIGACRMCVVDVGARSLAAACVMPVSEGMVVKTNTPQVRQARRAVLELILSNHERKCLSCVRSQNCELQDLAKELGVDENRFEQEIIFYLEKLDITEEKVRLQNHCNYFREVARSEEGVGRKLGFIAQELGREINTLGSKANEATMQKMVVEMKDELEKIKEQLLNIL